MSILGDIAHSIGHTVDSLAQDVGVDPHMLEGVVHEISGSGIDIFSNASRLGLSPVSFLRSMMHLLSGDPHQALLNHLVAPFKPVPEPLYTISSQWEQLIGLHQDTAQQIHTHITELFQGDKLLLL